MIRIAALTSVLVLASGCASGTYIRSNPSGATVRSAHGQVLGTTPYYYEDTEMVNHTERFTVEMAGYKDTELAIKRSKWNTGRTIGSVAVGLFTVGWGLAGLLWATDYPEEHTVELERGASKSSASR